MIRRTVRAKSGEDGVHVLHDLYMHRVISTQQCVKGRRIRIIRVIEMIFKNIMLGYLGY